MIKFIHEITDEEIGGKARGLKILRELGLNVPDACVIVHPGHAELDEKRLKHCLSVLGTGEKAVRSSAVSEDGEAASFAGQFESYLNLQTYPEIREAIEKCIAAAKADRVQSYASNRKENADLRISVILQNMVSAKYAGVVFSADPVTNRRDKVIIDAVKGIGEELVSGRKDPVHYKIFRSGSDIPRQVEKQEPLLTVELIKEILDGALVAEKQFGRPVDMEWAIDEEDRLHWLQVRPITTLQEVHYNELDTIREPVENIWTLGNIGEMMPGAVTPLTYSVSFYAVDYGLSILADAAGARSLKRRRDYHFIQMFYNRLFFNMTNMLDYSNNVWMNKVENVQMSICGTTFPGMEPVYESPLYRRIWNFGRQMVTLSWTKKSVNRLQELADVYTLDLSGDYTRVYGTLSHARDLLSEAFGCHLMASAQSGTLYSAMMGILTGNKRPPDYRDHHIATILLTDIRNVESADAVKSLESFARLVHADPEFSKLFVAADKEEALQLLNQEAPPTIRQGFDNFLRRHGHRCIRESELREKTWAEDPQQVIRMIRILIESLENHEALQDRKKMIHEALREVSPVKRMILRSLLKPSRAAVARRELTKGTSIKFLDKVRRGYIHLAGQLLDVGLLDDIDQVYFLTHDELGLLIDDKDPHWRKQASMRREMLPETAKLVFNDLSFGVPEPVEEEKEISYVDGQLHGIPVSSGIIEGRARIVQSIEDAGLLEHGEIMVSSFTDIGWTPYFSIIAGLITEIGSPLSHGAVVAREYGIPAVVGVKGARKILRDGDYIRLDGNKGSIELVK